MENLATDELCDFIVKEVGVPLPKYDYELKTYITSLPRNISISNGGARGIDDEDVHETFREGCLRIVNWHMKL